MRYIKLAKRRNRYRRMIDRAKFGLPIKGFRYPFENVSDVEEYINVELANLRDGYIEGSFMIEGGNE